MLKEIILREAKNSFRKLNAIIIQFFGGFVSLFLFMFIVCQVPLFESVLLGILGYAVAYVIYFAFTVFVSLLVEKKIKEIQNKYFLPSDFEPSDIYTYTIESCSVERNLSFDQSNLELNIDVTFTMYIQSNINGLPYIKHSIGMGENKALKFENIKVTPLCGDFKRFNSGEIRFEKTQDTEKSQRWRIVFEPRLQKGENASYKMKWSYSGAKFLSFEEFSNARTKLQIPFDKEFDSFARSTPVPCKELTSTITFPVGYPIRDSGFSVKKGGYPIEKEIGRINSKRYFTVEPPSSNRGWKLILEIEQPLISVSYIVQWRPPTLDS